ncbi:hypothetical protein [Streptomyces sp. SD15]
MELLVRHNPLPLAIVANEVPPTLLNEGTVPPTLTAARLADADATLDDALRATGTLKSADR